MDFGSRSFVLMLVLLSGVLCRQPEISPYRTRNVRVVFEDPGLRDLAQAAANGQVERLTEIIRSGVPINGMGKVGITPLYWAFKHHNETGFETLLKMGANPNLYLEDGTSFMVAFAEPIHDDEYEHDNIFFLKTALKYGGNPNLRSDPQRCPDVSPLIAAATLGSSLKRIDILLDAGAEIDYKTRGGNTALFRAATLNQYHVVWHLIQRGANFQAKTKSGKSLVTMVEKHLYWPPSEAKQKENPIFKEHYEARRKVIDFLRSKGYKFVAYEENPENIKNAGKTKIKNYVYEE